MNIAFSSVLLFVLIVPFIMGYRLGPGETPFWLFGLIFFVLLLNLVVDVLKLGKKTYIRTKYFFLWFLIVSVVGSAFFSAIVVRHKTAPVYMVHDIILQLEAAIQFLLQGQNPYSVTYFGTPLEQWHYSPTDVNPALYYFVMGPFYLVFSVLFYFLSITIFGFFDGRIPLYFLFFALLVFVFKIVKDPEKRILFVSLLAFNPALLSYTLEGRSDVFMLAFLVAGLYLLYRNKENIAGIPLALAFAIKQSVWPLFPLYAAFLYFKNKNFLLVFQKLFLFALVFLVFVSPFFWWNPKAFLDSTVFYLSGNVANGYPISGYGFGMVLYALGLIKNLKGVYPFYIWQAAIGIPLLFFLIRLLRKNFSVKMLIFAYGAFLFVFWYFSRYFNNSHVAYLSVVFTLWYFWPEQESISHENKV